MTIPVTITVQDTDGLPKEGLPVYAFSGGTYTGYHGTADAGGQVQLTLPEGDYRFRADLSGTQFWTGETDHCSLPGCLAATVVVTLPVTVTVTDTDAVPQEALPVYVFDGAAYTGYHDVTDAAGEVAFILPQGDYRFRADRNGTQFWSGETDHCAIPGCTAASVTVTIPVTVMVQSQTGSPYPDLPVYAFDGDSYTGLYGTSDANGQVSFTLPLADYRFRADHDGVQFWSGEANHCTIPGCLDALVEIPGGTGAVSATIDYSYDPLQRLVAADYSTGEFFHYSYDAVGNRLTQDTLAGSNAYSYDIANRLIEVDGLPYAWDGNGNLLDDGDSTFTYDHANRLSSVVQGPDTYSFSYNRLGDRLVQEVNGEPIDYTLDLAAGLTQVLSDGDNAYLYGVARIGEQQPEGWQYHLGDALGSVRQLADPAVAIGQAQAFQPFGSALSATGDTGSIYGFTGEWTDATGLVNLRARYYDPTTGRFFQEDPSQLDRNPYLYARANPLSFTDQTGLVSLSEIYRSLGVSDFSGLRTFLQDQDSKYPRWGLIELLLDANYLDRIFGISLGTFGRISQYPIGFIVPLPDCTIGVFADRYYTLSEYFKGMPSIATRMQPVDVPYWRSVLHRYRLQSGGYYRDTHYTDLPDYFSESLIADIKPLEPFSVGLLFVSDRFGTDYLGVTGSIGEGISAGILQYGEGYFSGTAAEAGSNYAVPLSKAQLEDAIKGFDIGISYSIFMAGQEASVNVQLPPYLEGEYLSTFVDLISVEAGGDLVLFEIPIAQTRGWSELEFYPYSNETTFLHKTAMERLGQ